MYQCWIQLNKIRSNYNTASSTTIERKSFQQSNNRENSCTLHRILIKSLIIVTGIGELSRNCNFTIDNSDFAVSFCNIGETMKIVREIAGQIGRERRMEVDGHVPLKHFGKCDISGEQEHYNQVTSYRGRGVGFSLPDGRMAAIAFIQ